MDQELIVGLLARTALFGSLEQAPPNVSELSGRPPRGSSHPLERKADEQGWRRKS